jgi:hypothetical protein
MIVNDELGRMWKEAVVIYFKLDLSKHLPAGTENSPRQKKKKKKTLRRSCMLTRIDPETSLSTAKLGT